MGKTSIEEEQPLLPKEDVAVKTSPKPLSIPSKLCYGAGGVPFMMTAGTMISYTPLFLLEVAMIRPAYTSAVLFGGRVLETIANPIVGSVINNMDSRFGKMKPWIAGSLPFLMISFFFNWIVPGVSEALRFAYYLLLYCLYLIALTFYNIPHMSLTMYLSPEQDDRDSATLYRLFCALSGSVLGNIIVSEFLASVDPGDGITDPCVDTNETVNTNSTRLARNPLEMAFISANGTIVGFMLISGLLLLIGTKERTDVHIGSNGSDKFWKGLKSVMSYRPFYIAIPAFITQLLTIQMMFSNTSLYLVYSLHIDFFYYGIIIFQASNVIHLPLWQMILSKIGKKKTVVLGIVVFIPVLASLFFLPEGNVVTAFIFCYLIGLGTSCAQLLPWSFVPDVIDDYVVQTGKRNDAVFYSLFQSFNKTFNGIGLGLSTLVLGFTGYDTGACQQPDSVAMTMRVLVSVVPICLLLISLVFVWIFPITDSRRIENSAILAKRRLLHNSSNGALNLKTEAKD